MKKVEFVLSGKCRIGDVGEKTPLVDCNGDTLFVGDIVDTFTKDEFGVCYFSGLTVVVSDKWTSYNDGTHVQKEGDVEYFVMGIKSVDFMKEDSEWAVQKVKSFKDVVSGEKWKEFGFNYV